MCRPETSHFLCAALRVYPARLPALTGPYIARHKPNLKQNTPNPLYSTPPPPHLSYV